MDSNEKRATVGAEADRDTMTFTVPNVFGWLKQQLPEEFVTHMRAAQREQLLAIRSLVDAAIERTEQADDSKGRRRVEIKVD